MPGIGDRLADKSTRPSEEAIREWLGADGYCHWQSLRAWIDKSYPGTFEPEWLFGGARHGWVLRYKKTRAFCTLIPEYGRLAVVIVFGTEERQKVERMLDQLPPGLVRLYEAAETYRDGKWLKLLLPADVELADLAKLLSTKRRPKPAV